MTEDGFVVENFPTSESANRMLRYVTEGFYEKSYVGKWLYQVMGMEYDSASEVFEELAAQLFPETATWGLMYHEMKWGLPVRQNLSYEERRRLIYRKRDYRSPMTPRRMEIYLENAMNFEVHVADCNDPGEYGYEFEHPSVFRVVFIGEDTLDSRRARELLSGLKQSHTTYVITDRIEIILDNRRLERLSFGKIVFYVCVAFWRCRVFDGTWLFDGSVLMNQKRCYGLGVRLRLYMNIEISEKIISAIRMIMTGLVFKGRVGCRVFQSLAVNTAFAVKIRERVQFLMGIGSMAEEMGEMEVITKTPDYWFFNGAVKMDGSRKYNSMYIKERME